MIKTDMHDLGHISAILWVIISWDILAWVGFIVSRFLPDDVKEVQVS